MYDAVKAESGGVMWVNMHSNDLHREALKFPYLESHRYGRLVRHDLHVRPICVHRNLDILGSRGMAHRRWFFGINCRPIKV